MMHIHFQTTFERTIATLQIAISKDVWVSLNTL